MPLTGGAADKFGNRYEGLWTVNSMIDVLEDSFNAIYLEEPGIDFAEFRLISENAEELHQVKRQNSSQANWRIGDLRSRGILDAFRTVTNSTNQKYVFVSTDNVQYLSEMTDRARSARNIATFRDYFLNTNKKLRKVFDSLLKEFKISSDELLFERLKRFKIHRIDEELLRKQVEARISRFTSRPAANVVDILAQYAAEQVHQKLNQNDIIDHLRIRQVYTISGVSLKDQSAYQLPQKPSPFISRASIVHTLRDQLSSSNKLILIRGVDGAGKTTLLTEFIEMNAEYCFYFFVGRDWTSTTTSFLRQISSQMEAVIDENNGLSKLNHSELRDVFARLCNQLSYIGRKSGSPYYLVVDGLENVRDEPGRETIIDLLQLDLDGLYVLGSTNRLLPNLKDYSQKDLDNFSPAEAEKYLSKLDEHFTKQQMDAIYDASRGLPVYLDQLRRELSQGKSISYILADLPIALNDLLLRAWQNEDHSEQELEILALVAHADVVFTGEVISTILGLSEERITKFIDNSQFVYSNQQSQLMNFVTEAHRTFVTHQLSSHLEQVHNKLIDYYQRDILDVEAIERLPMLLHLAQDKFDSLCSLMNVDYLSKSLEITNDISLVRRNIQLMIDTSDRIQGKKPIDIISKFSLMSSTLITLTEESADKSEIEALLSIGEYQKALSLAYKAPLVEDQLELLAVIGRELQQNNGSLLDGVTNEIQRMVNNIQPNVVLRERAIDIATDIFPMHPQLALDLLEKVADTHGKYSIDVMLALLAIRLEFEDEQDSSNIKDRIENTRLREFITANSKSIANFTATRAIQEAENISEVTGKLFLLRSWCNENRHNIDAVNVVKYALEIIQRASSDEYASSMLHLRQFAEPLLQYEYNDIEDLVEIFNDLKATALQKPLEEAIRLEIILIRLEGKNSDEAMHERLMHLYLSLAEIEDLDTLCYCKIQLLLSLKDVDPKDELGLKQDLEKELQTSYNQLLDSSADQLKVTERIIQALTRYDSHQAFNFASKLNLKSRRDKAYTEVLRVHVSTSEVLHEGDLKFIEKVLGSIQDVEQKHYVLVMIFSTLASNFRIEDIPSIETLIELHQKANDPIDLSFGYCYLFNLFTKSERHEVAEKYLFQMITNWELIDTLPEKVDIGFALTKTLSEFDFTEAQAFFDRVSELRKTHPLANVSLFELFVNLLSLATRSIIVHAKTKDFDSHLREVSENISQIPSRVIQVKLFADLAMRLWRIGDEERSKFIVTQYIISHIEDCEIEYYERRMLWYAAPICYHVNRYWFNKAVDFPEIDKNGLLHKTVMNLISKKPPSDPINLNDNNFAVDDSVAYDICHLIEDMSQDSAIHSAIRMTFDAVIYPDSKPNDTKNKSCRLKENTALTITRNLDELITNVIVPDRQDIKHEGYKVICYAQLARLKDIARRAKRRWDSVVPSWSDIVDAARNIHNITDRIHVKCYISKYLKDKNNDLARELILECQSEVYDIPNFVDRSDSLSEIAEAWYGIDEAEQAKLLLREAMSIIQSLTWDETKDEMAANILQAAHAIDPTLASSLTTMIDNPMVQRQLNNRVQSRNLHREPHKLDVEDIVMDYRPVANAAFQITKSMNSGTYYTIQDNVISQWLKMSSNLPFFLSYPVRMLEIQNNLGSNLEPLRRDHLFEVHTNVLDNLRLIGLLSNKLFPQYFSSSDTTTVPQSLKTIPVESESEYEEYFSNWVGKYEIDTLEIFDPEFSFQDLNLLLRIVDSTHITIITTWNAQGVTVLDSVESLFREEWTNISDIEPFSLRIMLFETEKGQTPIQERYYFINGKYGFEIMPNRNYLEKAFMHIHHLATSEVIEKIEELRKNFYHVPIRRLNDERVHTKTFYID